MEKPMNKMEDMEMDMVAGGRGRGGFRRPENNTNSMAANIMGATENANSMVATRGLPPVGHKMKDFDANSMAANVDEIQNASACVGK